LDTLWLNILLALIGNECPFPENICGVIIGIKSKQIKMSIWLKEARNMRSCTAIGGFFKNYIGFDNHTDFQAHPDPDQPSASAEKALYHL
jgi:hypothetical protein